MDFKVIFMMMGVQMVLQLGTVCSQITVQPGGSIIVSTGSNYYGNNVTLRKAFLPSGAHKSWIDLETKLPTGTLKRCFFFIHPTTPLQETSTFIRLQIWRPVDPAQYQYLLVWEKPIHVNLTSTQGLLYEVSLANSEQVRIQSGDHLGFSNEATFGAISFQYVENHKSFFRNIDNNGFDDYPTIGNTYTFDNIFLPVVFSMAAEVDPEITVQPGGSIIISAGSNYYGNNITLRDSFLPSGAHKSWLDFETKLPAGTLKRCFLFIHPTTTLQETSTFIRLQIWRPVDPAQYQYLLLWEKPINVDLTSTQGLLYTVNLANSEQVRIKSGDHLGFSNEAAFGAISFQYVENHKSYFRNIDNNGFDDYPTIGNTYTFDDTFLPAVFCMAAEIDPAAKTPISISTTSAALKSPGGGVMLCEVWLLSLLVLAHTRMLTT